MTPGHRRASDPPEGHGWRIYKNGWRWWFWYGERVWQDLVPLFALCIALYAVLHLNAESEERRDQNCIAFERDELNAVRAYEDEVVRLKRTEDFLDRTPTGQLSDEVRKALPQLRQDIDAKWREAKAAAAPPYCDEPDIGLPEPNPEIPSEPRPHP